MKMLLKKRKMVELDGKDYWILASECADDVAKLMTDLDTWVPGFCKELMRLVVDNQGGYFKSSDAINLAGEKMSKTPTVAERALASLVASKWIREGVRKGEFTAGPRSLVELEDLFIELGAEKCALTHTTVIKTSFYTKWLAEQRAR